MSTIKCLRNCQVSEKISAKKIFKLVKVVKPMLKLLRKKQRTNIITPSTCNYDIVESVQNDLNELELFQLDFKFFDEPITETEDNYKNEITEAEENYKNELLELKLLEEGIMVKSAEEPTWMSRSDMDICGRRDGYVTCRQRAEQQIPVAPIRV